jgi:starch synthase (maltosyl-transferring)
MNGAGGGRRRVVIEGIQPQIDAGRFPIKRTIGDVITVEADIFTDGHDQVAARLLWRHDRQRTWREVPLEPLGNDHFRARFPVDSLGRYCYTVQAWVDHFGTWRNGLVKKVEAGQDVDIDLRIGAGWVEQAADRAAGRTATLLRKAAESITGSHATSESRVAAALDPALQTLMAATPDLEHATLHDPPLDVVVDPVKARFSAWYELFPRSAGESGAHGTFRDVERRIPYIKELGFDVLYLPPIHPIGRTRRKGRNNQEESQPGDVGSPWGIGAAEGGHKAIHPDLGSMVDFESLVLAARAEDVEIALDIAFQVSPDHPYVTSNPEWFRSRPDGTVQYAENPPKKYQDIYPFDFESADWENLWAELEDIFLFWIGRGVRIFRVDNPHTKAFPFWEWCITRIKETHPDVLFLAEAFTTPRRMYRLAKLGFSQSYTYFAWRNDKHDLIRYMEELTRTDVAEYFRPNFWPNTPDILTEYLQEGGRPAFMNRLVLAAMLTSNYGIYGPAFELMDHLPAKPGSEEYLDSEKYQLRSWDLDRPDSLRFFIARVNGIRKENPALHDNRTLRFHPIESDHLVAFSKASGGVPVRSLNPYGDQLGEAAPVPRAGSPDNNVILTIVNMDYSSTHSGFVGLDLAALGIDPERPFEVHDLLSDARYTWHGQWNYVELDPRVVPAHVFRITQEQQQPPQPLTTEQGTDVDAES